MNFIISHATRLKIVFDGRVPPAGGIGSFFLKGPRTASECLLALELLQAAHFYEINDLVRCIIASLSKPDALCASEALRALVVADQTNCRGLRAAALATITANAAAVAASGEYRELAESGRADLLVEVAAALAARP
eukprot:tig00021037_g17424.t1